MIGGIGINPASILDPTQAAKQNQAPSAAIGSAGGRDGDGDGGRVGGARISPAGQLLSQLQQLQAQDPVKFKQVVTDIANQFQAAATQQGQTPQGQFLAQLASQFQNVANGGSLSQLQLGHHGHHAHQTYDARGQVAPQIALAPAQGTSQGPTGTDLRQLFQNIASEVSQALGK